jgi:hypothetical protein
MESCDDFFQWTRARATHDALHAKASAARPYPNGRDTNNTAGMKINATASKATVIVYPVPVDFWWDSNMQPQFILEWH